MLTYPQQFGGEYGTPLRVSEFKATAGGGPVRLVDVSLLPTVGRSQLVPLRQEMLTYESCFRGEADHRLPPFSRRPAVSQRNTLVLKGSRRRRTGCFDSSYARSLRTLQFAYLFARRVGYMADPAGHCCNLRHFLQTRTTEMLSYFQRLAKRNRSARASGALKINRTEIRVDVVSTDVSLRQHNHEPLPRIVVSPLSMKSSGGRL